MSLTTKHFGILKNHKNNPLDLYKYFYNQKFSKNQIHKLANLTF